MSTDADEGSASTRREPTDRKIERWIGRLLQIGVLGAACIVALGGAALFVHGRGGAVDYSVFRPPTHALGTLGGIVHGVFALDSVAIIQFGLVLLIATPVARVALTLVAFAVQRDRLYVVITAVVLCLLLYGLVWAKP